MTHTLDSTTTPDTATHSMRAAVVTEFGAPLQVSELELPTPGYGEALVKLETSGVCHTDLHAAHGDWPVKPTPPFIPGHEGYGTVVALGEGVDDLKVGDKVGNAWLWSACGSCEYCRTGWETLCESQQNGGYSVNGSFGTYMLVNAAYAARMRSVYQRTTGAILPPMSAFMLLQGIETVALRVERHIENARKVATFLRDDPRIDWVGYAGFEDSPYYALANKYLGGNPPSLLTFGVVGGYGAAKTFYDRLGLVKRLVNIGDVKSLACHPASTTHRQMTPSQHAAAGVRPEMIRLCVGIEHADDIIADLDQALRGARVDQPQLQAAE